MTLGLHQRGASSHARRYLVHALLLIATTSQGAQAAGLSEAELVQQLRAPQLTPEELDQRLAGGGAVPKAMRLPDRSGACGPTDAAPAGNGKNLEVVAVPMAPPGAPQATLSLQFEFASYRLTTTDRQQLDQLSRAMAHPDLRSGRFTVAGHTDGVGDDRFNLKLSCARSMAVREYLLQMGVAPDRLSAYGFGNSRLLVPSDAAAAANRRVEIRRADGG